MVEGKRSIEGRDAHSLDSRKTQWHMALPSALKLEFIDYRQELEYYPEFLLNTQALRTDLLVIKKDDGDQAQ